MVSCSITVSHVCSSYCDSLSTEAQMWRMKTGREMPMIKWLCNTLRHIKQPFGSRTLSLWRDRDVACAIKHGYTWRNLVTKKCAKWNQRKGTLGKLHPPGHSQGILRGECWELFKIIWSNFTCRKDLPSKRGQICLQHVIPPWLVYWPKDVSKKKSGIPQVNKNKIYGMKKTPRK